MRAHTSSRSRLRGSKKEIAVLADEDARLIEEFLKGEDPFRNLAGYLWRNEPLLLLPWGTPTLGLPVCFHPITSEESVSAVRYSKKFMLERRSGENRLEVDDDWRRQSGEHSWRMWVAKTHADLKQRIRAAAKRDGQNVIDSKRELRQLVIEVAPMYSLETWAPIFLEAAAAGDTKFI